MLYSCTPASSSPQEVLVHFGISLSQHALKKVHVKLHESGCASLLSLDRAMHTLFRQLETDHSMKPFVVQEEVGDLHRRIASVVDCRR